MVGKLPDSEVFVQMLCNIGVDLFQKSVPIVRGIGLQGRRIVPDTGKLPTHQQEDLAQLQSNHLGTQGIHCIGLLLDLLYRPLNASVSVVAEETGPVLQKIFFIIDNDEFQLIGFQLLLGCIKGVGLIAADDDGVSLFHWIEGSVNDHRASAPANIHQLVVIVPMLVDFSVRCNAGGNI